MSYPIDPAKDGAQMAFEGRMSYGGYLSLDRLLTAQTPCSEAYDEMLFFIQPQTSELWMRLVLHELQATRKTLQKTSYGRRLKCCPASLGSLNSSTTPETRCVP